MNIKYYVPFEGPRELAHLFFGTIDFPSWICVSSFISSSFFSEFFYAHPYANLDYHSVQIWLYVSAIS